MAYKKWIVADADKEKASLLSEKLNIDPFIAFLLVSRGIDDELSASDFMSSRCAFSSPYSLKDMDKAVSRINKALELDEKICVYGDYDCDGVTSTALLYTFFESLGANVIYFIPNRLTDGYGMNFSAIDEIKQKNTDLIITVDNGISAIEEAEYIYSLGMELIVTDHHQVGEVLPKAEAVINPHRKDNNITFRDFAGVGVAFKLACAVYEGDVDELLDQFSDLVAIGTIGDVVPLKSENRGLVRYGLELINNDSRIGITALRQAAGNADKILGAVDVAFQICPRINAAGRMDSAYNALELLISDYYEEARFKAEQLNLENAHRHEVENNIIDDIKNIISKNPELTDNRVIVLSGKGYHHGVIGIVASHIVSMYGKPAIILAVDENGEATGSARSIDGFNIFDAINSCADILTHFGGHPLAAGLGIMADDIDNFRIKINEFAEKNYPVMPVETLKLDCKLSPFYLNTELVDNLTALEPYGADNSQPVFGLYNLELLSVSPISEGKHIRLELQKKGKNIRAVVFRTTEDMFPYKTGDKIDLAVKLSKNLFKGKYYLSVQAVDYRLNGINDDKYFSEKSDYELFNIGCKNKTALYPSRENCAVVYKFLKQNNGWIYSDEDLYFALEQKITFGQLCFALKAFEEAGLICRNKIITLNKTTQKVVLDDTNILKSLKGRL
ncbi:MAG: single-stranded-DNA-specific exonuclease RecJ [Acetobacter sp.]|nr:single-stranded-DNA-specific exonuclease RecJ [Bacteroides sp.]MCM1340687.1 single-stranded-DNA-specific exonuclease RecJ [Acetobacter sp.]MCM1433798.1 single-stranded-DNA-specific exonuclease RecJ [Clostridiales bacterium]